MNAQVSSWLTFRTNTSLEVGHLLLDGTHYANSLFKNLELVLPDRNTIRLVMITAVDIRTHVQHLDKLINTGIKTNNTLLFRNAVFD